MDRPPAFPLASRRRFLAALGALGTVPFLARGAGGPGVPVLAYHRFHAEPVDSMTIRLATFTAHLAVLRELQCAVVPMQALLDWRLHGRALPERAVVLTADDGHRSQFEHMAPMLRSHGFEATLFVYPSAVSNASYAMTWDQLRSLQASGGFRIESHTFWHPDFARERRRLAPADFERFARDQLLRARARLEQELERPVRLLAWPFGNSDAGVRELARATGHDAAFALGNRHATRGDDPWALPRYLVTEAMGAAQLRRILASFST